MSRRQVEVFYRERERAIALLFGEALKGQAPEQLF
jgi:hypothetical protein